jgi:hypothetical protein
VNEWTVLVSDNLLKKRFEKLDFVAPGPHAIDQGDDEAPISNNLLSL